jgi:hypothetical protein
MLALGRRKPSTLQGHALGDAVSHGLGAVAPAWQGLYHLGDLDRPRLHEHRAGGRGHDRNAQRPGCPLRRSEDLGGYRPCAL